jgi:soluble lytic murein transglycosylase-like protein
MLRQLPVPTPPGSRIQGTLPFNWRETINKIDPSYVRLTEAAAKKYGIPVELLARLLYKESGYNKNAGIKDGEPRPNKAIGIPQMFGAALKEVGTTPEAFAKADAATQIDAGAAYLAKRYKSLQDWPKAVGAYHFGESRVRAWLNGTGPTYENIAQRTASELSDDGKNATRLSKEQAINQLNQWREMQQYLPYIFLGDSHKYDGRNGR